GLAHRVLGTKETVSALQAERMRAYFFERYSADNTVLAAAGKIDFARLVEQARRQCGHWQRTGAARVPDGPARGGTEFLVRDEKVTLGYQMMLTPAPALADERRYAASLLAQVLGGADNSRLHWALVETGLAEEASAGYDPRDGVGDFMVSLASAAERVDEVWAVAEKQMAELGASLTEDDLEKIKAKAATAATTAGERPGGRMQRLGRQWTYLGTRTTLEEELARIGAVTVADLRALLEEFPLRPRTVGRLLPK
ncbi:MAG TPA: insulinase family protein, partial [Phycisphaerales bacterium]|nr:insulinase family protein [Phycisphaerales bacterium]